MMDIITKKVFSRIQVLALCLAFFALCLIPGHFHTAHAQDSDARAGIKSREVRVDAVEDADDDVFIDEDIIYIGDFDADVYIDEEENGPDEDTEASGIREQRAKQDGGPGDAFPPETREMMEEEGISPRDLMDDPELRKRFSKRVERRIREKRGEPGEGDKKSPEDGEEKAAVEGLARYTSVIVKKNLFLRLGSGDEKRGPSYSLTAVISDTSGGSSNKAIIERQGGGESYYVHEGGTFAGEIEVLDIEDKSVKLDKSGEEMILTLGEGTGGGGRRGGGRRRGGRRGTSGGERRPGGDESNRERREQGGGGDFDPGRLPPFARRMMEEHGISPEELRDNPELRQKLRREFQAKFKDGGGARMRMERGRRGRDPDDETNKR